MYPLVSFRSSQNNASWKGSSGGLWSSLRFKAVGYEVKPAYTGLYSIFIQFTVNKLEQEAGLQQIITVIVYKVILRITFFFSN